MRIFRVMLLCGAISIPHIAQTPIAILVGRVVDATGAGIPQAAVTARHVQTNAVRTVLTEATGDYALPNLTPGMYEVIVEKEGFRRVRQKDLELQVQQTARLNVQLEVGAVAESIEVTAAVPVLNTENAVKGDVVINQEIIEMPLNGRSINDLAFLVPEVADAGDANSGSGMAINGARNDNTNFVIDGITNNDLREGGALASVPIDAVQEFKMQTSGYPAESGKLAGGVMTVALKTGGNRLHGALFEFLRNDKFDARNFFADGKDKLRRNQFGASLDGPVYVPRLYDGRDRTFFVFTWESSRQVNGSSRLTRVPEEPLKRGDFSAATDAQGRPILLRDPLASGACTAADPRGCFPGNQIPVSRFAAVAPKVIPYYPLPNRPGQANNYLASANSINNFDSFVVKGDHRFSANDTISVRYLRRGTYGFDPFSGSDIGNFGAYSRNPNALLGITHTHLFTPTLINEFRGGFAREKRKGSHFDRDRGLEVATQLSIPGVTMDPELAGFPVFTVNGYSTLGNIPAQPFTPTVNTFTWADSLTWVKGRHMVKFGGEVVRCQMFHATPNNARGRFNFLGRWTNDPFGDFLLGLLNNTARRTVPGRAYMFATNYSMFVQDDFKVTPNITLNLGLRYELPMPLVDKYDRMANFVPDLDKVVLSDSRGVDDLEGRLAAAGLTGRVVLAKDVGLPRTLMYGKKTNFAPRFGIAWRPFGSRTVLRGGYGIFYAGSFLNGIKNDLGNAYPFSVTEQFQRVASNPAALTMDDPFPAALTRISGVANTAAFELRPPSQYMQSWNVTIERQLAGQTAVEIAYTGSKGTHLGRRYNINQPFRVPELRLPDGSFPRPFSSFSNINYYSFGSNSSYNAGTVTLRRRLAKGIFYRASYTYSKNIDDASIIQGAASGGFNGAQDARNLRLERGRSDYDNRHVFVMNFTYEVPRSLPRLLRGWQLAGTGRASSGSPFTPQVANATLDQGEATRPDRIGRGELSTRSPERWFDLSAFVPVPLEAYRFGNSGRNILHGPGNVSMNLSLSKRFYFGERQSLQFRWEAFNFTNHTNFRQPRTTVDTADAATITSARAARVMQFGLRYQF